MQVYSPTVVYGTWAYPMYPPPPVYPPGYVVGAAAISFSIGVAIGSSYWRFPPIRGIHRARRTPRGRPRLEVGTVHPHRWRERGRRPLAVERGTRPPPTAGTQPAPAGGGGYGPDGWHAASAAQQRRDGPDRLAARQPDPGGGGTGPTAGTQPARPGGGGTAPTAGTQPARPPSGGDRRGWGGAAPAAKPAPSGYGGMGAGSQTRAASSRGSASMGASGRGGGGGRRR